MHQLNKAQYYLAGLSLMFCSFTYGADAVGADSDLYRSLMTLDKELFEVGFNQCDIDTLNKLAADKLEFFHDEGGKSAGKDAFIHAIQQGICQLDYHATRQLEPDSVAVYPLKKDGQLYGAIQIGKHDFFAQYPGQGMYMTSTAHFTHLWELQDGQWKLARVLSYGHMPVHQ